MSLIVAALSKNADTDLVSFYHVLEWKKFRLRWANTLRSQMSFLFVTSECRLNK